MNCRVLNNSRPQYSLKKKRTALAVMAVLSATPIVTNAAPAGDEFQVNTYTTDNQDLSAIAIHADGDFVVTWASYAQDGSGFGVYAQRFDASGNKQGSEITVNAYTTGAQSNPAIAIDSDGDFVVTWDSWDQDGSADGVYAQRFDASGNKQGVEFQVNTFTTSFQNNPAIVMDADGDFVVTWQSVNQDGGSSGIYAQRFDALGNRQGGEVQVHTYTTDSQSFPAIAMDADGDFVVTWYSYGQEGISSGVFAQRFDAVGNKQGGEITVNTYTTNNQLLPAIAMTTDGDFVVTWQSDGQDGSSFGSYAQRFDALGNKQGSELQVNTYTTGLQLHTAVAIDADGNFVVTWSSSGQDGQGGGVYAQGFDALGNKQGDEFQVNTYTTNRQGGSALAMNANGDFVVTWSSADQDGSNVGIFAQRYKMQTRFDLNVDGKADLLWRNETTGKNTAWFMDGVNKTPQGLPKVSSTDWQVKAFGDTDGDGRSDIIWRNEADGRNQIWKMIEGGKQTGSIATISDLSWQLVGADDFDGNGTDDILWRHSGDGRNTIYFMEGFNATSTSISSIPNLDWTVQGTGDLNGDDKADILWRNQSTGANVVWLMDGANNTSNSLTTIADLNWQVQGIGDLDANEYEDVVWRNSSTRAVDAWLIDAGLTIDQQNISASSGSNFQIEQVGDIGGDAKADIIWRDQVNGTNLAWEMDGVTRTPGSIQRVGDINWKIMPK